MKDNIKKVNMSDKPDKVRGEKPQSVYPVFDELHGVTPEIIEGILNDLVESKVDTGRKFKLLTGCKTNGFTDLELENLCTDPECLSCSNFRRLLKEEADKWL